MTVSLVLLTLTQGVSQNPHPTITKAFTLQGWKHYCLSVWSWVEPFSISPQGFAYLGPAPKLVLLPECVMVQGDLTNKQHVPMPQTKASSERCITVMALQIKCTLYDFFMK